MSNGTPQKKGLGPLAWIAIGCVGLVVVGGIVVAGLGFFAVKKGAELAQEFSENPAMAAEWVIKANPELELVEHDEDGGTMTVKNVKTGEVATFDYSQIAEGKFSFKTDEGETRFDASNEQGTLTIETDEGKAQYGTDVSQAPGWVPIHPDATGVGGYTSSGPSGDSGTIALKLALSTQETIAYYREALENDGFEVNVHTMDMDTDDASGMITAQHSDGRFFQIGVDRDAGNDETVVSITYGKSE